MSFINCFAEIRPSGVDGRGLFAKKDIGAGKVIFEKTHPLIAAFDENRRQDTCAQCLSSRTGDSVYRAADKSGRQTTVKQCSGCKMVSYCKKACQSASWKHNHKSLCKVFKVAQESSQTISSVTAALIELIQSRDKLLINEKHWIAVLQLKSHAKEMQEHDPQKYHEAQRFAEQALTFLNHPEGYSQDIVTQLACAVLTNSLTLVASTCDPLGLAFDPFACLANHSCEPNAHVIMDLTHISFRALKSIAKDEEILVSYVDNTEPYKHRQAELKKRYFFSCKCIKCEKGSTLPQDVFPSPSAQTQQTFMAGVADMRKQIPNRISDMKRRFGYEADAQLTYSELVDCYVRSDLLIATELDLLSQELREAHPVTRMQYLEVVMKECKMSGQYAVTRQPWPAARNEFILESIAQGDFDAAWLHALKTYVEIDPVLYPEPHNPLRVIHGFRLAKLSLYLASTPRETLPELPELYVRCAEAGLEIPILAFRCLQETARLARKSHGPHSAFAMLTQMELDEALEYLADVGRLRQVEDGLPGLDPVLKAIADSVD